MLPFAGHNFEHELCGGAVLMARLARLMQTRATICWAGIPTSSRLIVYDAVKCMLEVLKAGGFTNGGLNFDSKVRRGSYEFLDIAYAYILGMDTYALGLKKRRQFWRTAEWMIC